jgi:hypothetical protein
MKPPKFGPWVETMDSDPDGDEAVLGFWPNQNHVEPVVCRQVCKGQKVLRTVWSNLVDEEVDPPDYWAEIIRE